MRSFWSGFEKQAIKFTHDLSANSLKELESILSRTAERFEKALGGASGEAAKKFQTSGSQLIREMTEATSKAKKVSPGKILGIALAAGSGLALGGAIGGAIGSKVSKNTLGDQTDPQSPEQSPDPSHVRYNPTYPHS